MNTLFLSLIALAAAEKDPYQSIGQEVGSIYQKIGAIVSAGTYANDDIRSVHDAAQTAIGSLKYQINTIDWHGLVGVSAAKDYTSQLGDYIDGLSTVNKQLVELLTVERPSSTAETKKLLKTIASATSSASEAASAEGKAVASTAATIKAATSLADSTTSAKSSSGSHLKESSLSGRATSSSSSSSSSSRNSSRSSTTAESASQGKNHGMAVKISIGAFAAAFAVLI